MRNRTMSQPGSCKGVCRPSEETPGGVSVCVCVCVPTGLKLAQVEAGWADSGQADRLKPPFLNFLPTAFHHILAKPGPHHA